MFLMFRSSKHQHPGGRAVEQNYGVCWRSVRGCVRQPFWLSSVQEFHSPFLKVSFAPSQGLSRRCGKTGDSRFFSPFEKVAKDSRPASTPTTVSFSRAGEGSYSTEKQAYHFPVAVRRIVNVLRLKSRAFCLFSP